MLVSNASTLILLAKISVFQLFVDNAPKIIIPEEVKSEMLAVNTIDARLIAKEIENKKIGVEESDQNKRRKIQEQFHLDDGEAAAFVLYNEKKHAAILTDDGELIKLCKVERIPFVCAMAVVVRLHEKKILEKKEALEKMEKLMAVGRYSKELVEHFKHEVG